MNTSYKKTGIYSFVWVFVVALLLGLLSACNKESRGFALPEGDVVAGKANFVALNCNACHSIADIKWEGQDEELRLPLGGKTERIRTYGELLTSVINPSHKISKTYEGNLVDSAGQSRMKIYNDIMTVQELVDVVTFLQSEYEIVVPEENYYRSYY
ncbi:MAG: cytochrome C [Bacteroidetes bacterium]|nr:MAG: cytochrome C [Bacteroidota bacterium]